eukprot:g439.t1
MEGTIPDDEELYTAIGEILSTPLFASFDVANTPLNNLIQRLEGRFFKRPGTFTRSKGLRLKIVKMCEDHAGRDEAEVHKSLARKAAKKKAEDDAKEQEVNDRIEKRMMEKLEKRRVAENTGKEMIDPAKKKKKLVNKPLYDDPRGIRKRYSAVMDDKDAAQSDIALVRAKKSQNASHCSEDLKKPRRHLNAAYKG